MMQVPLHTVSRKIGQSGKINWLGTKRYIQFQDSQWPNDDRSLKQKIEFQIYMLKESLGTKEEYKDIRNASLYLVAELIVYIAILMFFRRDENWNAPQTMLLVNITFWTFIAITLGIGAYQIYKFKKISQMINIGIMKLNEKIQREGIFVYIVLKRENRFQKYCEWLHSNERVQIYEYINY